MSAEALAQAEASAKVGGSQDILTITSFDQQDLTGKYPVDSDGTFTFPPIGRVKAGGLTLRQLEAELKRLLMDGFFKDPQLSVGVETYKSQTIHNRHALREWRSIYLRSTRSILDCQPSPVDLKYATTSGL